MVIHGKSLEINKKHFYGWCKISTGEVIQPIRKSRTFAADFNVIYNESRQKPAFTACGNTHNSL